MHRIHGRPSSMLAYRPEGPETVQATGPVSGIMAQQTRFTSQDQTGERNLVRYLTDAKQGVERYQVSVNGTGAEYAGTDIFNAGLFDRVGAETEA